MNAVHSIGNEMSQRQSRCGAAFAVSADRRLLDASTTNSERCAFTIVRLPRGCYRLVSLHERVAQTKESAERDIALSFVSKSQIVSIHARGRALCRPRRQAIDTSAD